MAALTCSFFSETLQISTAMTVLLPEPAQGQIGMAGSAADGPPPVLYLLHGLTDDETIWTRRTSIERYAAERGLAVVMPRAAKSFYCDEVHGGRYWTFLSQELPAVVSSFLRVSDRREDTFVAGLSMGGYGAFKWALREPSRFAAAASLSGALGIAAPAAAGLRDEHLSHVFGGRDPAGTDDDLLALLDRADPAALPDLYLGCGTEDFLLRSNEVFLARAADRSIPVTSRLRSGGHDWALWDAAVQDVLAWLPVRRPAGPSPAAP